LTRETTFYLFAGDVDIFPTYTPFEGIAQRPQAGDLGMSHRILFGRARRLPSLWTDTEALARLARSDQAAEAALLEAPPGSGSHPALGVVPFPERALFEVHTADSPARVVSGDYSDHFMVREGILALVMADVSGKGVPAALLKGVVRSVLRNVSSCSASPGEVLTRLNRILVEAELGSMYVTIFLGWYDLRQGRIRLANAGHPLPYLLERSGRVRAFGDVTGPILGILERQRFAEAEEGIEAGERLVLYTDGVTEAQAPDGALFGHSRLMRLLAQHASWPAEHLCARLRSTVEDFQEHRPHDDATFLIFQRHI
jgi:sigma-B regulation protein RsbU (phosphoserine phosphatase)